MINATALAVALPCQAQAHKLGWLDAICGRMSSKQLP
jgi:hypothetical protein